MIFLSFGDMLVLRILLIRICRGTVSKALLISIAAMIVRMGGGVWLKPVSMRCERSVRRVFVE